MNNVSLSNGLEKNVPKLRFPQFQGEWQTHELSYYLYENTERNKELKYSNYK